MKLKYLISAFLFALGAACFAALPRIEKVQLDHFLKAQPYFESPVVLISSTVFLRSDGNAKGYFGARRDGGRTHKGIDLVSSIGQPVFASKSGRVVFSGEEKGYGNYIILKHPDGLSTRYAHLLSRKAGVGDWVEIGSVIGQSGKSGNANDPKIAPHLHFEVRSGEMALNPTLGLFDPSISIK